MGTSAFIRSAVGTWWVVALLVGCGAQSASPLPFRLPSQLQNGMQPTSNGYKLLYSFQGGTDGEYPSGGLTPVDGVLYGVTSNGGSGKCYASCGTVFSISTSGQEKALYSFKDVPDGNGPTGALIDVHGTLYGTTAGGGAYAYGTVFSITPSGSEKVLYSFAGGNDGADPSGGLTALRSVLYGATSKGGGSGCGGYGCGTVFRVTTAGKERVLYRFDGGKDGVAPNGQLLALRNALYGTTFSGGQCVIQAGCGTVFKMTTSGRETVLYRFKGAPYFDSSKDGGNPAAGLLPLNGTLYGTTAFGGKGPCGGCQKWGTVYKVSTSGTERVLHRFNGNNGKIPYSNLIAVRGLLYGTTTGGGPYYCDGSTGYHCGVIFKMDTAGKEHVLYDFKGYSVGDGAYPYAGLTALNGKLYGVTVDGGQAFCGGQYGCGTVFKISP